MRKINKDNKKYILIIFYNSNNDIINNYIKKDYKNISKTNREIVFAYNTINTRKELSNYFNIKLNKETEVQIFIYNFHKERFYKHELFDVNINSIDKINNDIINLVKNINKIKYISNNKINDFISNNKVLIVIIVVVLIIGICYMLCFLDIDDDEDEISEKERKESKEKAKQEKKKLINNEFNKDNNKEINKENNNEDKTEDKNIKEEKGNNGKEKQD